MAVDRMGLLLVAVKALFDKHANATGSISSTDAVSVLVQLRLTGDALSLGTFAVEKYFEDTASTVIDFSAFMRIYAIKCGITRPSNASQFDYKRTAFWVPDHSGQWFEVRNSSISVFLALTRALCLG